MRDIIRWALDQHARLSVPASTLDGTSDLHAAGLTSFATVQLMLALEEKFEVEFPGRMLNRKSWASIQAIESCLKELTQEGLVT